MIRCLVYFLSIGYNLTFLVFIIVRYMEISIDIHMDAVKLSDEISSRNIEPWHIVQEEH